MLNDLVWAVLKRMIFKALIVVAVFVFAMAWFKCHQQTEREANRTAVNSTRIESAF